MWVPIFRSRTLINSVDKHWIQSTGPGLSCKYVSWLSTLCMFSWFEMECIFVRSISNYPCLPIANKLIRLDLLLSLQSLRILWWEYVSERFLGHSLQLFSLNISCIQYSRAKKFPRRDLLWDQLCALSADCVLFFTIVNHFQLNSSYSRIVGG